ncbi:MAG: hypothetical protein M1549_00095 [Candidatus Dependentiae bacterium]|nr:hypothetical protein [Candidatus Dependentiae bacterium]
MFKNHWSEMVAIGLCSILLAGVASARTEEERLINERLRAEVKRLRDKRHQINIMNAFLNCQNREIVKRFRLTQYCTQAEKIRETVHAFKTHLKKAGRHDVSSKFMRKAGSAFLKEPLLLALFLANTPRGYRFILSKTKDPTYARGLLSLTPTELAHIRRNLDLLLEHRTRLPHLVKVLNALHNAMSGEQKPATRHAAKKQREILPRRQSA